MKKNIFDQMLKYKWKGIIYACLLILGIGTSNIVCTAADTGSIQIEFHGRTKENKKIVLEQGEFVLYYVGCMKGGQWKIEDEFQKAEVSLEKEGSSERNKQAKQLYAYALNKKMQGITQETNANGVAKFTNLREGIYLIAQTKDWQKTGIGTFRSAPFLVSVPSEIDGNLTWNMVSKPKSEWVSQGEKNPSKPEKSDMKTEKPSKVNTGDSIPMKILIAVLIISSYLIVFLWKRKKSIE